MNRTYLFDPDYAPLWPLMPSFCTVLTSMTLSIQVMISMALYMNRTDHNGLFMHRTVSLNRTDLYGSLHAPLGVIVKHLEGARNHSEPLQ